MALRQSGWLQPDASESSEGDDDNDDVFDESGISMPAAPRSGAPVSLPVGGRRGSVVQLGGGRSAALSFEAELAAALKRLRKADDSGDVNEMHAALQAVGGRSPAIAGRVISMVNGEEDFMEEYGMEDEGKEWRKVPPDDLPRVQVTYLRPPTSYLLLASSYLAARRSAARAGNVPPTSHLLPPTC